GRSVAAAAVPAAARNRRRVRCDGALIAGQEWMVIGYLTGSGGIANSASDGVPELSEAFGGGAAHVMRVEAAGVGVFEVDFDSGDVTLGGNFGERRRRHDHGR